MEVLRRRQGHQQRRYVEHLRQGSGAGWTTHDAPGQGNVSRLRVLAVRSSSRI